MKFKKPKKFKKAYQVLGILRLIRFALGGAARIEIVMSWFDSQGFGATLVRRDVKAFARFWLMRALAGKPKPT